MAEVTIVKPIRDAEICIRCRTCESFCPSDCITASNDADYWFDYLCCRGCNTCATVCPEGAIHMVMVSEEVA
jgi:pyruvate ferredoxin oxidoreductase delta subunit